MSDEHRERGFRKKGKLKSERANLDVPLPTQDLSMDLLGMVRTSVTPGHPFNSQNPAKVAIPRLPRDSDSQSGAPASASMDKCRVTHACEPCRNRKTKCSGERPTCKHCDDFGLKCIYAEGKRDRARKQIDDMVDKLAEYEELLRELSPTVQRPFQKRIAQALVKDGVPSLENSSDMSPPRAPSPMTGDPGKFSDRYDQSRVNPQVDLVGPADRVEEDFNRDSVSRATGYQGKHSEITWMQRLKQHVETLERHANRPQANVGAYIPTPSPDLPTSLGISPLCDSTYRCDDLPVFLPDDQVDPYERPPKHVADALLQTYLDTVHPTFPIVCKTTFVQQYQTFFDHNSSPNDNWLAILNCFFAIGAKYAHLTRAKWRGDERDHLVYFTRARQLGFNSNSLLEHAELQRVQVCGLMAFYLKACHQVNRSWAVSGIALRYASALGLNLKNDSLNLQLFSKEIRYRVWWALCSLEHELAVMTGRSISFLAEDCSVPLPMPVDESEILSSQLQPNFSNPDPRQTDSLPASESCNQPLTDSSSSQNNPLLFQNIAQNGDGPYFYHLVKLTLIMNGVLTRLYRVGNQEKTWKQTQTIMADLDGALSKWHQDLPIAFDFSRQNQDRKWSRHRNSLGLFYCSTKMIMYRPCLCQVDQQRPNQSRSAAEFNRSTATKCVFAAMDMLKLLPDRADPVHAYAQSPWWCLVHYVVEAGVVCMLEVSLGCRNTPYTVDEAFNAALKAVRWLQSMSADDVAAGRAANFCGEMLQQIAPMVNNQVTGLSSPEQGSANHLPSLNSLSQRPPLAQEDYSTNMPAFLPSSVPPDYNFVPYGDFPPRTNRFIPQKQVLEGYNSILSNIGEGTSMGLSSQTPQSTYFRNQQFQHWQA